MQDDEFLSALREDWNRDAVPPQDISRRFARERRRAVARVVAAVFGFLVLLSAFGGFLWTVWNNGHPLFALAATAFAAAILFIAVDLVRMVSQLGLRYDQDAHGLLLQLRDRIAAQQRFVGGARVGAAILLAATAGLWLLVAIGRMPLDWVIIAPAIAWPATALLGWVWQKWRLRQLHRQAEQCHAVLREFEERA